MEGPVNYNKRNVIMAMTRLLLEGCNLFRPNSARHQLFFFLFFFFLQKTRNRFETFFSPMPFLGVMPPLCAGSARHMPVNKSKEVYLLFAWGGRGIVCSVRREEKNETRDNRPRDVSMTLYHVIYPGYKDICVLYL